MGEHVDERAIEIEDRKLFTASPRTDSPPPYLNVPNTKSWVRGQLPSATEKSHSEKQVIADLIRLNRGG